MNRLARSLAVVGMASLAASGTAAAQTVTSWSLGSRAWDGLRTLADEASQLGCTIEPRQRLDLQHLGAKDTVWIFHPTNRLREGEWVRFVEGGGALVVLDDHGEATPLFARFGLRRAPVVAKRVFDGNPALPIADATGMGAYRKDLPVVANHPTALRGEVPASFRFSFDSGLLFELRLGEGLAILGSDPSLLINNMLELEGNLELARALVRTTCSERSGKVLLLVEDFVSIGEVAAPPSSTPNLPLGGRVRATAAEVNARAAGLAKQPVPSLFLDRWVAFGLTGCLVLLGLSGMLGQVGRRATFDSDFFVSSHANRGAPTLFELMRQRLDEWWQLEGRQASSEAKRKAHDLHEEIARLEASGTLTPPEVQSLYDRYAHLTAPPSGEAAGRR